MADLRAGLLGLGMMGRHHARVLRELDGVELVAIADPGGDPHGVAGGLECFADIDALIAAGHRHRRRRGADRLPRGCRARSSPTPACTPSSRSRSPHSRRGRQRIADAFEAAGLVGAVGHIERFNPALQELRRRLAAGELGEVYQIATRRQGPFPSRIADVGVVKDLATHDIDLTAWVAAERLRDRLRADRPSRAGASTRT